MASSPRSDPLPPAAEAKSGATAESGATAPVKGAESAARALASIIGASLEKEDAALGGSAAQEKKKKDEAHKITYKKNAVVFYRKICSGGAEARSPAEKRGGGKGCRKIPVLTNLKSVIYNYNQGRFPASAFAKP